MMEPSIFEETQELVVRLSDEVSRLRVERNTCRSSLESVSAELLLVREESRKEGEAHDRYKSEMDEKIVHMYSLVEKLVEKCGKLKIMCDLHVLERQKLEKRLQDVEEDGNTATMERVNDLQDLQDQMIALMEDKDAVVQHNRKLQDYIVLLEKDLKGTQEKMTGETERADQYRSKLVLAREEIAMLSRI